MASSSGNGCFSFGASPAAPSAPGSGFGAVNMASPSFSFGGATPGAESASLAQQPSSIPFGVKAAAIAGSSSAPFAFSFGSAKLASPGQAPPTSGAADVAAPSGTRVKRCDVQLLSKEDARDLVAAIAGPPRATCVELEGAAMDEDERDTLGGGAGTALANALAESRGGLCELVLRQQRIAADEVEAVIGAIEGQSGLTTLDLTETALGRKGGLALASAL